MIKQDIIHQVIERTGLQRNKAEAAVDTVFETLKRALAEGQRIELRGFGSFELNHRPPRTGRNPKSGQTVQVPEKYRPHFKAGRELRERVNS